MAFIGMERGPFLEFTAANLRQNARAEDLETFISMVLAERSLNDILDFSTRAVINEQKRKAVLSKARCSAAYTGTYCLR